MDTKKLLQGFTSLIFSVAAVSIASGILLGLWGLGVIGTQSTAIMLGLMLVALGSNFIQFGLYIRRNLQVRIEELFGWLEASLRDPT